MAKLRAADVDSIEGVAGIPSGRANEPLWTDCFAIQKQTANFSWMGAALKAAEPEAKTPLPRHAFISDNMLDRLICDFNIGTIERLAGDSDTEVWNIGPDGPELRQKAQKIHAVRN